MALFHFGKKKEEKKTSACCGKPSEGICCIKVLGAGCKTCHQQYENVMEAVRSLGLSAPVEYITDMEQIMEYGVMVMPAIVVDERVAAAGKLLSVKDVEKLLRG